MTFVMASFFTLKRAMLLKIQRIVKKSLNPTKKD